jgi:hypothetical protein
MAALLSDAEDSQTMTAKRVPLTCRRDEAGKIVTKNEREKKSCSPHHISHETPKPNSTKSNKMSRKKRITPIE